MESSARRVRFEYFPGIVPSVAEHCVKMQVNFQRSADVLVYTLGETLSELRQADLKLTEMRLAQRDEVRQHAHLIAAYADFMKKFATTLEKSVFAVARFTGSSSHAA